MVKFVYTFTNIVYTTVYVSLTTMAKERVNLTDFILGKSKTR